MKKLLLTNSLRAFALVLLGMTASVVIPSKIYAQCSYTNNQYPGTTVTGPSTVGQSVTISTCSFAGEYSVVSGLLANSQYTVSIAGFPSPYITIFDMSNTVVAFGPSPFTFSPPVNGNYKTQYSSTAPPGCGPNDGSCHVTTIQYLSSGPATPPTPTQSPAPPTCTGGSVVNVSGTPAANVTWYLQTSATGTSMATAVTSSFTVFANGTYYVRAYDSSNSSWSQNSSSITITNFPTATTPPAPTANMNPSCAPTGSVLTVAAAPAGYTYYWQGMVNGGTSNATNASSPYNATTSGTYYVAAYETATQCWSNTSGIAVTVDSYIPPSPVAVMDPVNVCLNASSAMVGANPGATSGTSVVTFGTNYTLNSGAATLTGNISIPAGATVTGSVLTFNGITTGPSQYLSDMSFNLTGASTYPTTYFPGTGATNAGPFNYNTTTNSAGGTVNLNMNNSWFQAATFATITLTVTYSVPAPSISWYSASTAGTLLGTGSPLEGVGTSVLPNTSTAGAYVFYAAATVGGCSSTRIPVTVNVTPVLAALAPTNVTCNGGDNGSFTLASATCGMQPFVYSLDNGTTFGAIPMNLTAGTYTILIRDNMMQVSAPITVVVTQPAVPAALTVIDVNYFNAEVSWTTTGNETSWLVEYGPVGFTPGMGQGTEITATATTATLTGLDPDTDYEFYVAANCGPVTNYAGPVAFTTNAGFFTYDNSCGPGFTDISATGTALNLTDDGTITVTAGFPISFQGQSSDQVQISNNGWVIVGGASFFDVYSQDLDDEEGNVYYETTNIGGEDFFVVQWTRPLYTSVPGQTATFQVMFNEASGDVYYIYDDPIFGGSQSFADNGGNAYISAQGDLNTTTVSSYNNAYLTNNSCIHFYNALCPNVQDFNVTPYQDEAFLDWSAGLYGEGEWTIIYGPTGFDPTAPIAAPVYEIVTNDLFAVAGGLTQNTTYDVYIYSECQADSITSDGLMVTFTTLPYCSNPSGITTATDVDSLETAWSWTESSAIYPIQSFNIQYGMAGFDLYSAEGTTVQANGTNFADTTYDAGFLAGGVYEVYIQAVCTNPTPGGTDTSMFVGPYTFIMPLSNDSVCGAEMLMTDGTVYTFNNQGATVATGEAGIAPPADGAQVTTGWTNSTLNNTTWFTFVAPASGSVRVNNTAIGYNGQAAVYMATDCGDYATFGLIAANDNEIGGTSVAPNFTICGLTPGATYYLLNDGFNGTTGNYSISVSPIILEAGMAGSVPNICSGEEIDLYATLSGLYNVNGVWSSDIAAVNASINGSTFASSGLAYQVFDFQYRLTDGCAYDSIVTSVQVFAPSSAGMDGSITACRNEDVNLLSGLNGNADLTGTWYDPSNAALPNSQITTANIPGTYNFDYIAGNGVCPDDTANVVVTVLNCDINGINETAFAGVSLYPNPSEGIVFISSDNNFSYVITDAKGRVIESAANGITSAQITEINLSKVETGVYFIRLTNNQAEKTFRVVIQ